ncbi:MAG TPA: OsmC family protein [Streptosporangiaceae bacterium]|nr:OsmC family protein [Streptosporangiaceae bacterium]
MDSRELKEVQAPLKARYREDPSSALITLTARGQLGSEEVACSVETGRAMVTAGLHPASGGDGSLACSGDMLLQALVACAGVTLRSVATNRGLEVGGQVRAEGDLDFRGTMGLDREAPVGFTAIRLSFDLSTSAPEEEVSALIKTTERYCVVLQTLARSPDLTVSCTATRP